MSAAAAAAGGQFKGKIIDFEISSAAIFELGQARMKGDRLSPPAALSFFPLVTPVFACQPLIYKSRARRRRPRPSRHCRVAWKLQQILCYVNCATLQNHNALWEISSIALFTCYLLLLEGKLLPFPHQLATPAETELPSERPFG